MSNSNWYTSTTLMTRTHQNNERHRKAVKSLQIGNWRDRTTEGNVAAWIISRKRKQKDFRGKNTLMKFK